MELKEVKELESHQRKRKGVSLEKDVLNQQVVRQRLLQSSKYVVLGIVFDFVHYDFWGWFPEHLHTYIYDSSQSIAFLLYIYAIYDIFSRFKNIVPVMYGLISMWLWFSIGDAFTMVYANKTLEGLRIEYYCLAGNILILCYKFRDYLYLQWAIFEVNLKIDKYEGVLAKN